MAFCVKCGTNVPDGVKFCTSCGNSMAEVGAPAAEVSAPEMSALMPEMPAPEPEAPAALPVTTPEPSYQPPVQAAVPEQSFQPPAPAAAPVYYQAPLIQAAPSQVPPAQAAPPPVVIPPADNKNSVISTWAYVGHFILFSLPFVGWLVCIIMAFAAKNLNRRNLARAMIVLFIIGLVLAIITFFLVRLFLQTLLNSIGSATDGLLGGYSGFFD